MDLGLVANFASWGMLMGRSVGELGGLGLGANSASWGMLMGHSVGELGGFGTCG